MSKRKSRLTPGSLVARCSRSDTSKVCRIAALGICDRLGHAQLFLSVMVTHITEYQPFVSASIVASAFREAIRLPDLVVKRPCPEDSTFIEYFDANNGNICSLLAVLSQKGDRSIEDPNKSISSRYPRCCCEFTIHMIKNVRSVDGAAFGWCRRQSVFIMVASTPEPVTAVAARRIFLPKPEEEFWLWRLGQMLRHRGNHNPRRFGISW